MEIDILRSTILKDRLQISKILIFLTGGSIQTKEIYGGQSPGWYVKKDESEKNRLIEQHKEELKSKERKNRIYLSMLAGVVETLHMETGSAQSYPKYTGSRTCTCFSIGRCEDIIVHLNVHRVRRKGISYCKT